MEGLVSRQLASRQAIDDHFTRYVVSYSQRPAYVRPLGRCTDCIQVPRLKWAVLSGSLWSGL